MFVRRYLGGGAYGHIKEIDPLDATPEYYEDLDPDSSGSVARDVTSTIVEHKTSGAEYVDTDGSSADDICRVCHENTSNFTTSSNTHTDYGVDSQPQADGSSNCMSCHLHTGGFSASGGSCTGCHASLQPSTSSPDDYRRQVTGTGNDFERTAHHVTDLSTTEIVTDEDCEVCHDQTGHQTWGDDPVANAGYKVSLHDPDDTGTNYTYDGTGSSIESLCVNCHDSDGATAYDAVTPGAPDGDPFTDGRTPTNIASNWAGSSHDTALTTEACLSCHGGADSTRSGLSYDQNAHGSANTNLLSSLVAGESPANVQEELCYACHDGSPASTNIESLFNGATNYQDATSGTGLLINQRHDVSDADQTYSSAVVECSNCHDPHMATSSNKNIDPDTPTSAYTFTYDTSDTWTGSGNKSYNRDGYNFTYYNSTADWNPMNPIGCTGTAATRGPAVADPGNTGDETAASSGTYTGPDDGTYTLEVTTGGASGVLTCTTGITGDDCNPSQTYAWTDATPIAIGGNGVEITLTDGPGAPSSVGSAVAGGGNSGDDTGTSGGTFTGGSDIDYTVTVSQGGAPGSGGVNVTDVCTGSNPSGATCESGGAADTLTSSGTFTGTAPETYTLAVTTSGGCGGNPSTRAWVTVTCEDDTGGDCGSAIRCDSNPLSFTLGSWGLSASLAVGTTGTDLVTTESWEVQVTSAGSDPQITVTTPGSVDDSGPTDVTAFGTPIAVGTQGVTISFADGGDTVLTAGDSWTIAATAATPGDGLTLGDIWTIDVTAASSGCITTPEPDMITFCLVCHDGNVPTGVTMSANMVNIATEYRDTDYHGRPLNAGSGNGKMKAPWADVPACDDGSGAGTTAGDGFCDIELSNSYAALQCTTCHDGHGSDNIFHLRSSITVRGQVLNVGGGPGSGQEANPFTAASDHGAGDTSYLLPCFDGNTQVSCTNPVGVQQDHKWGAWCSFCHDLQTHGQAEDNSCRTGHKHGGGAF
jgi:hypothetical protein